MEILPVYKPSHTHTYTYIICNSRWVSWHIFRNRCSTNSCTSSMRAKTLSLNYRNAMCHTEWWDSANRWPLHTYLHEIHQICHCQYLQWLLLSSSVPPRYSFPIQLWRSQWNLHYRISTPLPHETKHAIKN